MYKESFIDNEIRKLALIFARLMGLNADGKADEFVQLADSTLLNEYNIDWDELPGMPLNDFKALLQNSNYNADKLDVLAQILYRRTEPFENIAGTFEILKKVLIVYDKLEQQYHRQSLENINKRNIINQFLDARLTAASARE